MLLISFILFVGAIYHYHVSMDAIVNNSLTGKGLTGNVIGPVSEVNGKIGGAVLLFGSKEYIDFGDMSDTCLGDIDLCQHGFYLSLWVMVNGQYSEHGQEVVISSPTFDLRHDRSGLSATVHVSIRRHNTGRLLVYIFTLRDEGLLVAWCMKKGIVYLVVYIFTLRDEVLLVAWCMKKGICVCSGVHIYTTWWSVTGSVMHEERYLCI